MADITTPHAISLSRSRSRGRPRNAPTTQTLPPPQVPKSSRHGDLEREISGQTQSNRSRSTSSSTASTAPDVSGRDVEKGIEIEAGPSGYGDGVERSDVVKRNQSRPRSTLSRTESVISRIRSRKPRNPFSHPLTHAPTAADVIVDFDGKDDPYMALNWPFKKKAITTVLYGLTTMGTTFASAVFSPAIRPVAEEFGVSTEVSTLGTSLFLFGLGLGPLLFAPLSEVYGRKLAVLTPYFLAAIFSFATAVSKDLQTVLITRFFAGFFGSAPVTNTGGVLGDLWAPEQRGVAIVGYAMAVVGGPVFGPIIGGALTMDVNWRWTQYITGIMMLSFLVLDLIFVEETFPNVLLVYKARRLRHESGNWALHARHEEWDVSVKELAEKFLIRPFQMLTTPICFLMALYASFCYGILYLNLSSFPIEFEEERGWNQVVGALPFLALLVGILCGAAANIANQKFYFKRFVANNHRAVPEARLPPMMVGSVMFAVSMFMFGWTSDKSIPWIAPCIAAACMGFGFFTIFQAALNYLIDTFQMYAASAVAANTFLRSAFAGAFPLFASPMFHNLGINWASSLLGFFAIAMIPIPYLFYIYGRRIRARGKWSQASI